MNPRSAAAGVTGSVGPKPRRCTYSCPSGNRSATLCAQCTASAVLPTPAVPPIAEMSTVAAPPRVTSPSSPSRAFSSSFRPAKFATAAGSCRGTSDLAARREAGTQLLQNPRISVSAAARSELITGQVDARLLAMLAALAAAEPVQVTAFGDFGPGASAGMPLRAIEVAVPARGAGRAAGLRSMLAFVRAQRPPYLPAQAAIVRGAGGSSVLSIEFAAPSPVGLLQTQPAS